MISGVVNARRKATVRLTVLGPGGQQEVTFLIDTGFNGALTLPAEQVEALGLALRETGVARLADGSEAQILIHQARVLWDGAERAASVVSSAAEPLLGMSLVLGHKLTVEMVDGGAVTIERL